MLNCPLYGKHIHRQRDQKGKDRGEYVFITGTSQVGIDDCHRCKDEECLYGFNNEVLLKNKKLRRKVLDHVYDASLDDELLANGLTVFRELKLRPFEGDIYSKTCYEKLDGKKLEKIDTKIFKARTVFYDLQERLNNELSGTRSLKSRIIIKRKKKSD